MANVAISNLTTTWNNVSTTFTGIKLNVTDTASAAGSLLMDLQVGGVSRFYVRKDGRLFADNLLLSGLLQGATAISMNGNITLTGSTNAIRFNDGLGASDLFLLRDAANTLAQRNGVNAQTFRLYNTFTDASNYERAKFEWASNVLRIGTEKAGTGTARNLEFQTDGTTRLTVASDGNRIGIGAGPGSAGISINCDGAINCANGFATLSSVTFNGQTSAFLSSARNVVIRAASTYYVVMDTLPTSSTGLPTGALWNNSGVLNIA